MRKFVVPAIFQAIDKFTGPVRKMGEAVSRFAQKSEAELNRLERKWRGIGDAAMKVGRNSAIFTAALVAPLVYATKQAVDFEDKMADVGKTTGMSGDVLERFGDSLLEMSTKTRTSINDLVKIGEIGGQLGVTEDKLLSFVDSSNKFNVALGSDFSGGVEEAITAVGNIKALFAGTRGLDISDAIQRTGSAINELGAVGSGTSSNISDFTLRLGALPDALKPSLENTLALGTFLEELGINAQIGAGGVSNLLLVAGKNINGFAQQMNVTSDAAKKMLAEDPTEFMKKFATSFEGMAPDVLAKKLEVLGIGSQETIKVIGALAAGTDRLTKLQEVANSAFADGTSLQNEYNKKNSTAAAQWGIMKNNLQAAAITLGQAFLPVLTDLLQSITPMIRNFGKWAKNNKAFLGTIMKVVAGVAALSAGVSVLSFGVGGFAKIMTVGINVMKFFKYNTLAIAASTKIMNAVMMMTPWGMVAAGAVLLGAAIYGVVKAFNKQSAAERVNAELQERTLEKTIEQRAEIKQLTDTLRTHNQTSSIYIDALKKIEQIQPGITEKYNLQEKSVKAISAAERELTENILKRARADAASEMLTEKYRQVLEKEQEMQEWSKKGLGTGSLNYAQAKSDRDDLQQEIDVLAKMAIATDQEPLPGSSRGKEMWGTTNTLPGERAKKQSITIDFKNLPAGVQVTDSGDKVANTNQAPALSSTR